MDRGIAAALILVVAALSCSPDVTSGPETNSSASGAAGVAMVEGEALTALELRLAPGAGEEVYGRALDQAIHRRLAAAEARRRGLDTHMETAAKLLEIDREAAVREQTVLRDALFASIRGGLAFSEEDLRAHYDATKLRYAERQLRLRRRPFASREEAERALGEKGSLDDPSTVSLGPLAVGQLPRTVLPEVLSLRDPRARAVAGSEEEGWSLIELTGVLPAEPRPFEAVRGEVEASLREREAAAAFRALLDELRATADVRVDEDALSRLSQSGSGEGQGARPGRLSDRP